MIKKFIFVILMLPIVLFSWDERPGEEDWKEHDRIFRNCQKVMKASVLEQKVLDLMEKEKSDQKIAIKQKKIEEKNKKDTKGEDETENI